MFFYFHCRVDFYITSFKTCLGFYIFDCEVVRIKHFQKRKRNLCKNILGSLFCGNFFALVFLLITEAAIRGALCKKVFLEISQHSQENACARASFSIKLQAQACNFFKKEALAQVFSCECCEISKNTFFTEHVWKTTSIIRQYNFASVLVLNKKYEICICIFSKK